MEFLEEKGRTDLLQADFCSLLLNFRPLFLFEILGSRSLLTCHGADLGNISFGLLPRA